MPRAKVKNCEGCGQKYPATRSDSKWCSQACRYKVRAEDAKFDTPKIPQSGVVGITFSRVRKRWEVRIPVEGWLKYVGSVGSLEEALKLRKEILEG